jgi:hypothetical protein
MTAYTTISDATATAGKAMEQWKLRALRDNPIAITEGSSGAPKIQTAALNASCVTQGKLNTSLQQSTGSATGNTDIAFTGGTYTLGWGIANTDTGSTIHAYNTAAYTAGIANNSTSVTWYFQARYINATAPYNLGDGDIALFMYAEITPGGDVVRVDCADAPPWYYNGPNRYDPRKVIERDGKKYMRQKRVIVEQGDFKRATSAGMRADEFLARLKTDDDVDTEITHAIKNRDMLLIPHPFGAVAPGNTVVLINPVDPLTDRLALLHESPDEISPADLIMRGEIKIGNQAVSVNSPGSVMPVSARWKSKK